MLSHYDVLGVPPEASDCEVRHQYQRLALRLHPDRPAGSHTQFTRLQEAWNVLADPHQRAEYDMQLKRDQLYQQYPISEELFLEDLHYHSPTVDSAALGSQYSHRCRCGGQCQLSEADVLSTTDNEVAVLCDHCSLAIIVLLPQNRNIRLQGSAIQTEEKLLNIIGESERGCVGKSFCDDGLEKQRRTLDVLSDKVLEQRVTNKVLLETDTEVNAKLPSSAACDETKLIHDNASLNKTVTSPLQFDSMTVSEPDYSTSSSSGSHSPIYSVQCKAPADIELPQHLSTDDTCRKNE